MVSLEVCVPNQPRMLSNRVIVAGRRDDARVQKPAVFVHVLCSGLGGGVGSLGCGAQQAVQLAPIEGG